MVFGAKIFKQKFIYLGKDSAGNSDEGVGNSLGSSLSLDIVYHANFNKTNVRNVKCHSRSPAVLAEK